MDTTIALSELRRCQVEIEPHEAVAIVQQLMHTAASGDARPPYGPLMLQSVAIAADGSVHCLGTAATPSVLEVAIVLQALLADSSSRVPGGLRYAVGRALLEVDAPPFDSIHDFSTALDRFECGDRIDVIAKLHRRAAGVLEPTVGVDGAVADRDRRQHSPSVADLRRHLRQADLQLYEAHQALAAGSGASTNRDSSFSRRAPMAACMVAGVALLAAGEFAHAHRAPDTVATRADVPLPAEWTVATSIDTAPAGQTTMYDAARRSATELPSAGSDRQSPGDEHPKGTAERSGHRVIAASTHVSGAAAPARRTVKNNRTMKSRAATTDERRDSKVRGSHDAERVDRDRGVLARIRFEWNNPFR